MSIVKEVLNQAMIPVPEWTAHTCGIVSSVVLFLIGVMQGAVSEDNWRLEAQQRIEQIRKSDVTVCVTDTAGKPVSSIPVHVAMTRHAFPWGTCVKGGHITGQSPEDATYREKLVELFNCAVLENELKWNAWHGAYGPGFNRENTEAALKWLKERAFRIRGHCLVWHGWENLQPWGASLADDLPDLRRRILEHIDELSKFTRDYVDEWDVVNEPVNVNEVLTVLGEEVLAMWFQRARAALPDSCRLFINEYNIVEPFSAGKRDDYEAIIQALLDAKAPLEGIGFQSHFHLPPESPVEALQTFDRFARFGLPIVVTEFDVNTKDEDRQAQFTRDFLTAAFSHPSCTGFVFWGFWESAHWRPDAALFRKDWSEKPNLRAYRDLVFNEWWTDETGPTNENGKFALRAFKGTYRITVGTRERTVEIETDKKIVEIEM